MAGEGVSGFRPLEPGIGEAVAARTVLRRNGGERETWGDVADRVAYGNVAVLNATDFPTMADRYEEMRQLREHIAYGRILMSGRHLQHGDANQPLRNMEVFTNCLEKSTKILTLEFGPVEIGSIVGERVHVLASDGEWRPADVKVYGEQTLYWIEFGTLNGGRLRHTVKATANHRWLLRDGTVTDALKVGDVLQPARSNVERDPEAVVHGLIYGDGTAHKSRSDSHRVGVSYGRTYASIRVCKQDAVQDEIHRIFDEAGFRYTTPPHAKGDRVYYLGKYPYGKELPCTTDPDYIEGFIYGWWLADGYKAYDYSDAVVISTANEDAVRWLEDYAAYAGYSIVSLRKQERKKGDGSYANGRALYTIRLRKGVEWKVREIKPAETKTVYCVEEPVTQSFTLANGLLTGNCSTGIASFIKFYLLLNGSGVGRSYADALMKVDWEYAPDLGLVLDPRHPDAGEAGDYVLAPDEAIDRWGDRCDIYFRVPDSREGWAQVVELIERMAYERVHKNRVLILDFSDVRPKGSPIGGMQNRPASGPVPLMESLHQLASIKGQGWKSWKQAMYADHYLASCVAVGGARRAARIAVKPWTDPDIFEFINIKQDGGLWSANNSIGVDADFWTYVRAYAEALEQGTEDLLSDEARHAYAVFQAATRAQYEHGTGEPGFINLDRLVQNEEGLEVYADGHFMGSEKYQVDARTESGLLADIHEAIRGEKYKFIVNPCGEIALFVGGGYCVIADVAPFHADDLEQARDAFLHAARALIRVNRMDSLYNREVARTNRIGVGLTGIFEFAWKFFGLTFRDLIEDFEILMDIDEEEFFYPDGWQPKAWVFWHWLRETRKAVEAEADRYSDELGVARPHTVTTIKPAGTTSKLFGLTEGAHLPAMLEYLRWVQFQKDDPLIDEYAAKGYPVVREVPNYEKVSIVGFPTQPVICRLGIPREKLVTAAEATMEEQYKWVALLEKFWLGPRGNQVSYTLKYDKNEVSYERYQELVLAWQPRVRCISVMPASDWRVSQRKYGYVPEEPVSAEGFEAIQRRIRTRAEEVVTLDSLQCASGACPL